MNLKVWPVIKTTLNDFSDDNITSLGGGAFVLHRPFHCAAAAGGRVYRGTAVRPRGRSGGRLMEQVSQNLGPDVARLLDRVMSSVVHSGHGTLAFVLAIAAVLFGATTIFAQVQGTLNIIWDVKDKPGRSISNFLAPAGLQFPDAAGVRRPAAGVDGPDDGAVGGAGLCGPRTYPLGASGAGAGLPGVAGDHGGALSRPCTRYCPMSGSHGSRCGWGRCSRRSFSSRANS